MGATILACLLSTYDLLPYLIIQRKEKEKLLGVNLLDWFIPLLKIFRCPSSKLFSVALKFPRNPASTRGSGLMSCSLICWLHTLGTMTSWGHIPTKAELLEGTNNGVCVIPISKSPPCAWSKGKKEERERGRKEKEKERENQTQDSVIPYDRNTQLLITPLVQRSLLPFRV